MSCATLAECVRGIGGRNWRLLKISELHDSTIADTYLARGIAFLQQRQQTGRGRTIMSVTIDLPPEIEAKLAAQAAERCAADATSAPPP